MRNKEFWIALGVGAAIGGVAALLYAPQTGTVTRKKLKRGLEDLGDTLEDAGEYLKEQAERLGEEPKSSSTPARISSTTPLMQPPAL